MLTGVPQCERRLTHSAQAVQRLRLSDDPLAEGEGPPDARHVAGPAHEGLGHAQWQVVHTGRGVDGAGGGDRLGRHAGPALGVWVATGFGRRLRAAHHKDVRIGLLGHSPLVQPLSRDHIAPLPALIREAAQSFPNSPSRHASEAPDTVSCDRWRDARTTRAPRSSGLVCPAQCLEANVPSTSPTPRFKGCDGPRARSGAARLPAVGVTSRRARRRGGRGRLRRPRTNCPSPGRGRDRGHRW